MYIFVGLLFADVWGVYSCRKGCILFSLLHRGTGCPGTEILVLEGYCPGGILLFLFMLCQNIAKGLTPVSQV